MCYGGQWEEVLHSEKGNSVSRITICESIAEKGRIHETNW